MPKSKGNSGDSSGTREDKAVLLAEHAGASVYRADWRALVDVVPECDAVIVDAPYSERTHAKQRHGRRSAAYEKVGAYVSARGINYAAWDEAEVGAFVGAWSPRAPGWFLSITDSELYPAWRDALRGAGRYVFAPIPVVQTGMNVRLAGDGPSNWTCWLVVARPRTGPCVKWGTLPGAYTGNPFEPGQNTATASRRSLVIGGKPQWLMRALVRDYTRPGNLVVDPCCGAGTTVVAALDMGRRAIGGDVSAEHAAIAAKRLEKHAAQGRMFAGSNEVSHATQSQLFDEGEEAK